MRLKSFFFLEDSQNADDIADNYLNDEKEKWKRNKNGERNEKKKYKDNSKKSNIKKGHAY